MKSTANRRGEVGRLSGVNRSNRPRWLVGSTTKKLLIDQVAMVSGVGPGLGRAIALALAAEGAAVVVSARNKTSWEPVVAEIRAAGGVTVGCNSDISESKQVGHLVHFAVQEFGGIDVLVNNAFTEEDWRDPFTGFDPERWRAPIAVNLMGTLALSQAVVPHLKSRGGGAIVMVTTLSVKNPVPLLAGYATSKGALTTAAQVLAKELGHHHIRVNCVAPGHIDGGSLNEYFAFVGAQRAVDPAVVAGEVKSQNPLGRIATPAEIAPAVVFLASPMARMITGQTLNVNCGRTLG